MRAPARIQSIVERLRSGGIGATLARGASAFLVIHLVGVGASFGVQVMLARSLGAGSYGAYVYSFSWMILLLLFCRAGLGTTSLRFVAAFVAREDWSRLRGYLGATRTIVLLASLVVAGATALVVQALGERLPEMTRQTLLVCCLCMPAYALLQVAVQTLRGFQRVLLSQVPTTLLQPLLLAGGVAVLWLNAPELLDAPTAMWLTLGSALGALTLAGLALRRVTPSEVHAAAPQRELGNWMRVAAPLMVVNVLNVALERTDVLFVGSLLGESEAGIYASAGRVATVISFGLTAVSAWAAPLISDCFARGDRAGLERLVRAAARAIFALTVPFATGVIVLGKPILGLFGPDFTQAYTSLAILAGGQLLNALAGPVGFLMTMTGRQNSAARILGIHAGLMLILSFVLIPRFGIEGAAAATALTRGSWNVTMAIAVWRQMGLRTTII